MYSGIKSVTQQLLSKNKSLNQQIPNRVRFSHENLQSNILSVSPKQKEEEEKNKQYFY